jgi:hypothetical protein
MLGLGVLIRRKQTLQAHFITEPKVHATEMRCYMRDPDGYLIEVGQTTMTATPLELYR